MRGFYKRVIKDIGRNAMRRVPASRLNMIVLLLCMTMCFGGCQISKGESGIGDQQSALLSSREAYKARKVILDIPENASYQRFLTAEGAVFGVDMQGELWGNRSFPESLSLEKASDLLINGENIFLVESEQPDSIRVYNQQGEPKGKIVSAGNVIYSISDGMYVFRWNGENGTHPVVSRLDEDRYELGEELGNLPQDLRGIAKLGNEKDFLYLYTADSLLGYSWNEKTYTELFQWSDVGIQGSFVQMVWKVGDIFHVFAWDGEKNELVYYQVSQTSMGETLQRRELVIATLQSDSYLQQLVTNFNNAQTDYSVKIQKLDDMQLDQDAQLTRLNAMLLTDQAPDMLWLQNMNYREQLAEKGYLTDLTPFLDKSQKLTSQDIYPEILSYGTQGDMLYTIPYQFELETLAVPSSLWLSGRGWTYPEMVEYLRNLEEYRPFRDFWLMKMWLFNYNLDYFFDEEKGEAYFDSEDFRELMEYMKDCHDRENLTDWENLTFHVEELSLNSLQYLYSKERELGEKMVLVGYPTREGNPKAVIRGMMEAAIVYSCEDKEGAWSFIESYLSAYPQATLFPQYGLWSNRNTMQVLIDKELPLFGLNEVEIKDEEGNVIGKDVSEHLISQESVDVFLETLSDVRKSSNSSMYMDVRSIVWEETESYFAGQKSLEDVTDIIQSRVSLLLQER